MERKKKQRRKTRNKRIHFGCLRFDYGWKLEHMRFFTSFFLSYYYSESYFAFFFPSFIPSITSDMVCRPRRRILKIYTYNKIYNITGQRKKRNRQISAFFTLFYFHKRRAIHHFWPHAHITHVHTFIIIKACAALCTFQTPGQPPCIQFICRPKENEQQLVVHDEPELVWNSVAQNRQR